MRLQAPFYTIGRSQAKVLGMLRREWRNMARR
jgi:hypothetical protein